MLYTYKNILSKTEQNKCDVTMANKRTIRQRNFKH